MIHSVRFIVIKILKIFLLISALNPSQGATVAIRRRDKGVIAPYVRRWLPLSPTQLHELLDPPTPYISLGFPYLTENLLSGPKK